MEECLEASLEEQCPGILNFVEEEAPDSVRLHHRPQNFSIARLRYTGNQLGDELVRQKVRKSVEDQLKILRVILREYH